MLNIQVILLMFLSTILYINFYPQNYYKLFDKLDELINSVNSAKSAKSKSASSAKSAKSKSANSATSSAKQTNSATTSPKQIETWRDLPFIGQKDIVKYHQQNPLNISRKNLPIYYPISSPLEDNYFDYANSITSPKLSMLRSIMRTVELHSNQGAAPIIFNYAERPLEFKQPNKQKMIVLANTVISSINEFGKPLLKVELLNIQNEIHEETDNQSRMCFDMKIKLFYADSEQLGKSTKPKFDILYLQPEFIFEKAYKKLVEDQFFAKSQTYDFRAFLSKLIIVGSEHLGFLPGRYGIKRPGSKIR
jgi:hypothetical protein